MQSTKLVIEGEFLTHDQMIKKGLTERFGINSQPITSQAIGYLISPTGLWIYNNASCSKAESRSYQKALQDEPKETDEAQTGQVHVELQCLQVTWQEGSLRKPLAILCGVGR